MSRLKDIMDVDVEPLQSQAYRKAKEAAENPSGPSVSQSPLATSSALDNQDDVPTKRRRPNRGPKSASHAMAPGPSGMQQHGSSAGEAMRFSAAFQAGPSDLSSTPGSTHQSSPRGSESTLDVPVRYTRVTHRISKAKKGVPVHICDICIPPKTFSRAEHLRRHQLSHREPAYPCTFQGCDKAFHRPDLLARHVQRHEDPDERPDNSPTAQDSPTSSGSSSDFPTPLLNNVTGPRSIASPSTNRGSLVDPTTPSNSVGLEDSSVPFNTTANNFHTDLSDSGTSTFPPTPSSNLPGQDLYPPHVQHGIGALQSFATAHSLSVRIPEESHIPGLSNTKENSPLCSSESDSVYSTQSEVSQPSGQWSHQARSISANRVPEWASDAPQFHPNGVISTSQELPSPQFSSMLGQFESYASSGMTSSSVPQALLDVPSSVEGYSVEPVRAPTFSMYRKPLAPVFSESTPRGTYFSMGGVNLKLKPFMEQQLEALCISASVAHFTPLDAYISTYWETFHIHSPIVHRCTFDPAENILLSSAMAAIGTQFHNTAADRQKGVELNDYCRKSIDFLVNWDLHTMQAILLTEAFTRYRGRKTNVRLSRQFEEVYNRLLRNSTEDQSVLSGQDALYVGAGSALHGNSAHPTTQHPQHSDAQTEWLRWVDTETRQRLLVFCFSFDIHQAMFHEQSRSNVHHADITSLLHLPCPDHIWNASTALDWQTQYRCYVPEPCHLFEGDLKSIANRSAFMHWLAMSSVVCRLPPREDSKYPNKISRDCVPLAVTTLREIFPTTLEAHACLALYNTPLHDLLAIAGDTWVFGKKLTPPSAFHSAQSRLKTWSTSLNAATATLHACHLLSTMLSLPSTSRPAPCISDYWAYYVSALICWAFSSRHHPSSSSRSSSSSSSSQARHKAQKYVTAMLRVSAEELLTSKSHVREDAAGVIDAVCEYLEMDAVGSKCMMLVDAVHVLTQLKENGKARWWSR